MWARPFFGLPAKWRGYSLAPAFRSRIQLNVARRQKKSSTARESRAALRPDAKETDQYSFGLGALPPGPAFCAGAIPGGGVPLWMDGPVEDDELLPQPVRSKLNGNATSSAVSGQMMRLVIGCN